MNTSFSTLRNDQKLLGFELVVLVLDNESVLLDDLLNRLFSTVLRIVADTNRAVITDYVTYVTGVVQGKKLHDQKAMLYYALFIATPLDERIHLLRRIINNSNKASLAQRKEAIAMLKSIFLEEQLNS